MNAFVGPTPHRVDERSWLKREEQRMGRGVLIVDTVLVLCCTRVPKICPWGTNCILSYCFAALESGVHEAPLGPDSKYRDMKLSMLRFSVQELFQKIRICNKTQREES
jgi:hypothetical protein